MRPIILPIISFAALLLLWEVYVWAFDVPAYLLPAPSSIWASGSQILGAMPVHIWPLFSLCLQVSSFPCSSLFRLAS